MGRQPPELPVLDNPLFLRFARERLRPRTLLPWALVTLVFAAFIFLLTYLALLGREVTTAQEAARSGFTALVIFQAFILMLLGTGRVASTVATDKERGLLDYHRITPMTGTSRIVGYMFGAPVLEYVLFLLTMPFALYAIIVGEMAPMRIAQLYAVGLASVWLYHSAAMVAGMVTVSPRRAAMLSQGMVLLLYLIVPQLSGLGFRFLQYLTARPTFLVVAESELGWVARGAPGATLAETAADLRVVHFVTFTLGSTVFTLLFQALLIFSLLLIVHRRWRRANCHAFSKSYALGFYAAAMGLMVGCLWPYLARTELFHQVGESAMQKITYGFVLICGVLCLLLAHLITPTRHDYLRGLRRARKLKLREIPHGSDEADATTWMVSLMAVTVIGFTLLMFAGRGFDRFDGPAPSWPVLGLVVATLLGSITAGYLARAWGELRGMMLFLFLVWICPVLAAIIVFASVPGAEVTAAYLAAPSAPVGLVWAVLLLAEHGAMADAFAVLLDHALALTMLSLVVQVGTAVAFSVKLLELRRGLIRSEAAAARLGDPGILPAVEQQPQTVT